VRAEIDGLLATLGDVFVARDGKSILHARSVRTLAKQDRRALREAAENAQKAAEGAGDSREIAVTRVDGDEGKSARRPQSKMSDKSFNSSSSYGRPLIHETSEATVRKIQDTLADLVEKSLYMAESIP
jgi:hypothetical protein